MKEPHRCCTREWRGWGFPSPSRTPRRLRSQGAWDLPATLVSPQTGDTPRPALARTDLLQSPGKSPSAPPTKQPPPKNTDISPSAYFRLSTCNFSIIISELFLSSFTVALTVPSDCILLPQLLPFYFWGCLSAIER